MIEVEINDGDTVIIKTYCWHRSNCCSANWWTRSYPEENKKKGNTITLEAANKNTILKYMLLIE